jgi:protein ImuB
MEEWRVACVRIPRFPIGAVLRARHRADLEKRDGGQLLLPLIPGGCCSSADSEFSAPGFAGVKSLAALRAGEVNFTAPKARAENFTSHEVAAENCKAAENSHWDEELHALTDGATTRPKLRAVTAAAAREGVRAGMLLSEARALCSGLQVTPWDDHVIESAIMEMTALLVQVSPQVTPVRGSPGMWWVGASGFAIGGRTAGGAGDRGLARELAARARQWHPRARVSVAGSCVAARAATWSSLRGAGITVIPPGRDGAYLESAPLTLLPMEPEMRDALHALGVRTVGALAELPGGEIEQRWGDDGMAAWRLAHGDDPRRPVLARIEDQPHAEMELASPAATMEPVLFLARPAIENLVAQMVSLGRSIASLSITLTLDDARGAMPNAQPHTVTREIRLPRPLACPAPLFERCRGLLSRWPLTAPVTALRITVLLTSPLAGEQGNLLNTSWRDPGAADAALERVRAELGPDIVVTPQARDGYTFERSGTWQEEQFSAAATRPVEFYKAAENLLRLLEKPERVDVDRDPDPRRVYWRGRAIHVLSAIGPERLSGDWWNDGYQRDYWRCESGGDDERELVLYRDAAGWWVQGWYD